MKLLIVPILANTTSSKPLLVAIIVIIVCTLTRKPSPGSTKQRDMWSGLVALFVGPFGFWIKGRWRDGLTWLGIWLLILGPLFLFYMSAPAGKGLVAIALGAWILAYIGLVIVTVIRVVRARVGAEPEPPTTPTDLTVAKALDQQRKGSMNRQLENLILIVLVAGVVVAAWMYFQPYLVVSHIKHSLNQGDADALSRDIDFPTLRSNLKDQLNYLVTTQAVTGTKDNPFSALGAMIGGSLVNNVIDAYVTPYGLSQLLTDKLQFSTDKSQQTTPVDKQALDRTFKAASSGYDSLSRFSVTLHGDNGEPVKLVLTRSGLSWRLTNILLPANSANSGSNSASSTVNRARVQADIEAIKTQLQLYESMNGFYPTTEQGLQALVTEPNTEPKPPRWYQLFREMPKDAWGSDYIYRCPGPRNVPGYDIFSAGQDRTPDTADDDWGR
jgi:type II secretion system protein G